MSGGQRQADRDRPGHRLGRTRSSFLDEPTAALGVVQTKNVLETIKRVRDKGIAVVLISHSMPHVLEVPTASRCCASAGASPLTRDADTTVEELVGAMTGALDHERRARA